MLLSLAVFAAGVRADEIRLKDGSKIVGTVVGYEDGSFKVETAYGFALVRKDSIAEIIPADAKGAARAAKSRSKQASRAGRGSACHTGHALGKAGGFRRGQAATGARSEAVACA